MKRVINSAQLSTRLVHLTIDPIGLTAGGEDQKLVDSVGVAGDIVTVTLKPKAKSRGGRPLGVVGLYEVTGGEEYSFTGASTEAVQFTTKNAGVHGDFGVTLIVNDSKLIYEA